MLHIFIKHGCGFHLFLDFMQVIIGSADLKANHAIRQHVDIVSESQKYNKCSLSLNDSYSSTGNDIVDVLNFLEIHIQVGEVAGGHHGWQSDTDIHGY